jgi:hypothetical protein
LDLSCERSGWFLFSSFALCFLLVLEGAKMIASHRRHVLGFLLAVILTGAGSGYGQAPVPFVEDGWDLYQTAPGTFFNGVPFLGVPLGTFDFGGGPLSVGNTDTIVERMAPANRPGGFPASDTVPIELVALHLQSVAPVDFGSGLGIHFLTLQSERGGPLSTGSMTINAVDALGGTFDSFFDVFYDIRLGALNGPIVLSDLARITSTGNPWDRTPPPGAVTINGVNTNLNGTNNALDFWPLLQIIHATGPSARIPATHVTTTATTVVTGVPEASSALFALAASALAGLGYVGRAARRRRG